MIIVTADDENPALRMLNKAIMAAIPDAQVHGFNDPFLLLEFAKKEGCEVAFLDIEMREMSGMLLAKQLKELNAQINIVFVTGYSEYALDAYQIPASDYLLKPATPELITQALEKLRHPVAHQTHKRVKAQCFGNFEVFVDGKPLQFARSKTKELLGYLIVRHGALCSNNEISAVLWENEIDTPSYKDYFRQLVADLMHTLRSAGVEEIVNRVRRGIAIVPDKIDCDLYRVKADPSAINLYFGEFMTQYSWAEFMNAYLENASNN